MAQRRHKQYPIVWDQSDWERALWRPEQTFRPVLALIENVASTYGREAFVRDVVELPLAMQVPFEVDAQEKATFVNLETQDCRAVALTHTVHRTIRELMREQAARLVKQVDVPSVDGAIRRTIVVRWDQQRTPVTAQIKKLHRAVLSQSQFSIEAAWFSLTPRAHEYLSVGYQVACRRGDINRYTGVLEVPATVIPVSMVAPALLKVILPYAIHAVEKRGRRPVHPRDEALANILGIFNLLSGADTGAARRGDHHGPSGPGADFVCRIEEIFTVELMAKGSTHAVARAKRRMAVRSR